MTPIERTLLALLEREGPVVGTAALGRALWPDRDMQAQGAALAASGVLKRRMEQGHVATTEYDGRHQYHLTDAGSQALAAARLADSDPRQLSLLD